MSTAELTTETILGPDSAGLFMTPEEFDAVTEYDKSYRYELIHGVLVVNPIPGESQVGPNELLGHWLNTYKHHHPEGSCLDATLPERYIRTSAGHRLADRVVWVRLGRRPNPRIDVPTIAIEFVSAGKRNWLRDYHANRDEYLAAGVLEYWVIDRFERRMTVYQKQGKQIVERVISEDDDYETSLLPGFTLPLAELLAEADLWDE